MIELRSRSERDEVIREANATFWCDSFVPMLMMLGIGFLLGVIVTVHYAEKFVP